MPARTNECWDEQDWWLIQKFTCITASVNPESLKLEKAALGGVQ